MKKRKGIQFVLFPLVLTISLYGAFYSKIASKPSDAGFWFIIALGMSLGVALTRFIQWFKEKDNANHIHAVWRDFNGDFGHDLLREHYQNAHHHQ